MQVAESGKVCSFCGIIKKIFGGTLMKEKSFMDELSQEERRAIKENHPIQPQLIFKIIRSEGEEELSRKFVALAFSALAAGIFVSFSFFFAPFFIFIWATHNLRR